MSGHRGTSVSGYKGTSVLGYKSTGTKFSRVPEFKGARVFGCSDIWLAG